MLLCMLSGDASTTLSPQVDSLDISEVKKPSKKSKPKKDTMFPVMSDVLDTEYEELPTGVRSLMTIKVCSDVMIMMCRNSMTLFILLTNTSPARFVASTNNFICSGLMTTHHLVTSLRKNLDSNSV